MGGSELHAHVAFVKNRRVREKVFAFVTAMDESVGRILEAIRARDDDMFANALIVFSADNGGPLETMSNHPMRGGKFSDFQGGARVAGFAAGGLIPSGRRGTTFAGFIHIADWLPTFCGLAMIDPIDHKAAAAELPPIDGIDIWPQLIGSNTTSPHPELPLSSLALLDTKTGYKIMLGTQRYNTWAPSRGWPADYRCIDRNESTPLECGSAGEVGGSWGCLFNIYDDPNERVNLAGSASAAQVLRQMQTRYLEMRARVWVNCDPPSTCRTAEPQLYCEHVHSSCNSTYCPIFDLA